MRKKIRNRKKFTYKLYKGPKFTAKILLIGLSLNIFHLTGIKTRLPLLFNMILTNNKIYKREKKLSRRVRRKEIKLGLFGVI